MLKAKRVEFYLTMNLFYILSPITQALSLMPPPSLEQQISALSFNVWSLKQGLSQYTVFYQLR